MLRNLGSTFLLVLVFFATACSNYDVGNYTYYESDWCVVQGKGDQIALMTDERVLLRPTESLDSVLFKAGNRYRVVYIPLGSQGTYSSVSGANLVEITSLQPVLVDDVQQRATFSGVVNDPVWMNDDPFFGGGFLNFDFQFYNSDAKIKHGIYLLQDSLVNRKIYLRFGHDAKGDSRNRSASALASFPTRSLQQAAQADSLIIVLHSDYGYRSYRLALRDTL